MKKIYEIWAEFEDGTSTKVESYSRLQDAKNDIEVKNLLNIVRVVAGVEFPHGFPTYVIK